MYKNVCVLGSTGALGTMCLEVLSESLKYKVVVATGHRGEQKLLEQKQKYSIDKTFLIDANKKSDITAISTYISKKYKKTNTVIVNAIQGSSGYALSLAFVEKGFDLFLANKETLVIGGPSFMKKAKENGVKITPLDTEMVALSNLIRAFSKNEIEEYIITASGGPFKDYTEEQLKNVNFNDATKHPNWKMGEEISVDSATLLNKALEVVEASVLFSLKSDKIKVLLHKESFVHSLVLLKNGMMYAELYTPDQKTALREAFGIKAPSLSFNMPPSLSFEEPKFQKHPALFLGFEALKKPGLRKKLVLYKEEAFKLFKGGIISFQDIIPYVQNKLGL